MVETITAFAVATTAIFGALEVHVRVMDQVRQMHQEVLAWQAIENEMETLKASAFSAFTPGEAQPFLTEPDLSLLPDAHPEVIIRDTGVPGLIDLEVRMVWTTDHGRRVERSLATRLANHGGAGNG